MYHPYTVSLNLRVHLNVGEAPGPGLLPAAAAADEFVELEVDGLQVGVHHGALAPLGRRRQLGRRQAALLREREGELIAIHLCNKI